MIGATISRYRIRSTLGTGGMGIVYEAEDLELGRQVAIKLLPAETAATAETLDRFKREARAASALNHPHICTIHDVGIHDGQPFLVMERMRGQSLQQAIAGTPLPIERVLALGEQIADALDAAHRAGIVHRDLKPANLFVTDRGEAKVLDFGLAKLMPLVGGAGVSADAPTMAEAHLTSPGTTLGTVAYMSPEQARGEPVDARSDLFSLGVVLYEMTTGRLPFQGASTAERFRAILSDTPIPPSQVNPAVPAQLDRILLQSLEKDIGLRYQSAAGLRADLRRLLRDHTSPSASPARDDSSPTTTPPSRPKGLAAFRLSWAIGIVGVVVALGASGFWLSKERWARTGSTASTAAETRLAVLPFENHGSAEEDYFADGMTDEVRGKLSGLPGLAVIARASSNEYRHTSKNAGEVARELGVSYLLTGTVRWQKSGETGRIRVSPELVEIRSGDAPTTRWQKAYDAELVDVFEVQGRIAAAVAQALELELGATEAQRLEERPTSNMAAYDLFLKGRGIFDRSSLHANQRDAAAQFERAVALDPGYAVAWAYLSISRSLRYASGVPSPELAEGARSAAETALVLAPRLPEAYWADGFYNRAVTRDNARAVEIFRRGLEIAPRNVDLLRGVGQAAESRGKPDEALAAEQRAAALDPRSWRNQLALAQTLVGFARPREAREAADRGLALNATQLDLIFFKAMTYLQEGDLAKARAVVAAAPKEVEPTALVVDFARFALSFLLDAPQRDLLLRLTPSAFDDDRAEWAGTLAIEYWLRGDPAATRKYADESRRVLVEQLKATPEDAYLHVLLGLNLALLAQDAEALREGGRALDLMPIEKDALTHKQVLRIYTRIPVFLGRREEAIAALERLLRFRHWITPGWLRVDPTFDSLRDDARFERLAVRTQ